MAAFHALSQMTWIKRIALAVGGLVLLAAVAAAVFVASFDANRYKPQAIDWMKANYQRSLTIDGPIELSLFPRLAVKVSKLRLSERGRADTFAAVDEASLSLAVLPLLRKELVVDRVHARGVQARLTRDAKGVRNIDDLLARPAAAPGALPAEGSRSGTMRFDIGGVSLEDVRLNVRDDQARRAGTLTLSAFTSGRLAPGIETPLALKAQVELTQPQPLKLALDGKTRLAFDAASGAATLREAKFSVVGDTAALKGLAATLEAKRLAFDPAAQKIDLEALTLTLAGRLGGKDPLELALDWPRLAAAGEQLAGSPFNGRLKLEGATALAARFESGALSGGFDALRLPGFALGFDGQQGTRKLKGELKANLLLEPAKAAARFERLALRADIAEPGLAPLQLTLDGQASAGADAAQWALQGALNQNRFESQGRAAFGAGVPSVQASARFDRLDLNQLLAPNQATPAPAAAAPADTPVDLSGLKAVNGRFGFSAGHLAFRQYKLADAKRDATLDGGTLRIVRLAGGAWGGSIDASGSAQAAAPQRVAIKLAASGVNVNALLKDVAGKDLLEGTGRISADLATSGNSVGALRSGLAGSAALQLRDGAVKGINLARSLRQAKAALAGKQDALAKAQATEKTDFSELNATARIADGVATSDDLDVKSPFLRIGGAGKFDIGRGRIDYTARTTVVGAPGGQDGAELAALKGVTVPVQLSGPFDAIDWKIRWSGVAAAAVENKLKEKLAEKLGAKLGAPAPHKAAASTPASAASPKDAAKDKLKEKLKGLLGK
jgi:AsmA protein